MYLPLFSYGLGTWHLYDIRNDPGETTDLAASKPQLLKKLQDQWEIYADEVGVILTDEPESEQMFYYSCLIWVTDLCGGPCPSML